VKGSNPLLRFPDRAMRQAKSTAIVALVRLIQRGEEDTPHIYERTLELWSKAKDARKKKRIEKDPFYFIPICDVEKQLRKNHLSMIFNTTALFGNTEAKRVYSWRQGAIGPLNQLLNIAGARLRYLAMTRYPYPKPKLILIERTNKKGKQYSRSQFGYRGTGNRPIVLVVHPHLPSLDFVDLIRGHVFELCRQCFIYSVPHKAATRYIDLLIFRLRPFLDHIYTGACEKRKSMVGTNEFIGKAEKELDTIIEMIKGKFGTRNGYPQRVTHKVRTEQPPVLTAAQIHASMSSSMAKRSFGRMLKFNQMDDTDAERFTEKVVESAAIEGTRSHKRMSWGTMRPSSAISVFLGGDYIATNRSGYILSSEIPTHSGSGKLDYALFVRKIGSNNGTDRNNIQGLWSLAIALDLKTKCAFDWGVRGKRRQKRGPITIEFPLKKRRLTDHEWNESIRNTPSVYESRQVTTYASGLLQEYQKVGREDPAPPTKALTGILLTDASEFPSRTRRLLSRFIIAVYEHVREELIQMQKMNPSTKLQYPRTLFEPKLTWEVKIRIAAVIQPITIKPQESVQSLLPPPEPIDELHTHNPFENRMNDRRHFILYLTASIEGSPGDTAAVMARYWHGLEYALYLSILRNSEKIAWIDLTGEFGNPILRKVVFRYLLREQRVRKFMQTIQFIDLSKSIESALYKGKAIPSIRTVRKRIKNCNLVIVSGLDSLRTITIHENEGLLDTLAVHVAEAANKSGSTILWFSSPIPLASTSILYKQHQLRPLMFDSPLQPYVDDIVLNMPFPPKAGGGKVSSSDHFRGLVKVTPDMSRNLSISTMVVPPCYGWSKRFASKDVFPKASTPKERIGTEMSLASLQLHNIPEFTENMASELFPFLKSWLESSNRAKRLDKNIAKMQVKKRPIGPKSATYRQILSRLTFSKDLCESSRKKTKKRRGKKGRKKTYPLSRVKTKRKYWSAQLDYEPYENIPLPPQDTELQSKVFSPMLSRKEELSRLKDTIDAISNAEPEYGFCHEFLSDLNTEITKAETQLTKTDALQSIIKFLKEHLYTENLWFRMEWFRNSLFQWPMPDDMREILDGIRVLNKDFLLEYGNYLFVLLAVIMEERTLTQMELQELWEIMRPWVTLQLGAEQVPSPYPDSEFDARAIYERLVSRVRFLNQAPTPNTTPLKNIRYGIMVDVPLGGQNDYRWYLFENAPYGTNFIAGCVLLPSPDIFGERKIFRANTVIPHDQLETLAAEGLAIGKMVPIIIANHHGVDVLYEEVHEPDMKRDYSQRFNFTDVLWGAIGVIRYGTRYREAPARLRYINVINPGWALKLPPIDKQQLPKRSPKLGRRLFEQLGVIQTNASKAVRVKCDVIGTPSVGQITFYEGKRKKKARIPYLGLHNATRVLRLPYDSGLHYQGMTWNPSSDIVYNGLNDLKIQVLAGIRFDGG
jgi:hypothetical protein